MEIFRGHEVMNNWKEKFEAAQLLTKYVMYDEEYNRVPHKDEDNLICHDCLAYVGEFHVPGCDVERCPICSGQIISCGCDEDEEDEEE